MLKEKEILKKAMVLNKKIVFPEAGFSERVLKAVKYLAKKKICTPILIGDESSLVLRDKSLLSFTIINPKTSDLKEIFAKQIYEKRKDKGVTQEMAKSLSENPFYFGTMLVENEMADGMVAGAEVSTAESIRPALELIKAEKKGGIVSSVMLMLGKNKMMSSGMMLFSDCGLNVDPSAAELVEIAKSTEKTYFDLTTKLPKIAFLSFSTKGSGKGESVEKVKKAVKLFNGKSEFDGEFQVDAALREDIRERKAPDSKIKGSADVLIFPNLDAGNMGYKLVENFGGVKAIGPILQGLKKPVNDVSRGCSVMDIVLVSAITALQCKKGESK